jgi:hypothetical protein
MKAVPDFAVDLSWVVEVKSPEGTAVIQQRAGVGDIQRSHGDSQVIAEFLSLSEVEHSVTSKVFT